DFVGGEGQHQLLLMKANQPISQPKLARRHADGAKSGLSHLMDEASDDPLRNRGRAHYSAPVLNARVAVRVFASMNCSTSLRRYRTERPSLTKGHPPPRSRSACNVRMDWRRISAASASVRSASCWDSL